MTWGDQALVSKARSFIFNRGFYSLSYTQRIIGDAKSAVFDPYQKPGFHDSWSSEQVRGRNGRIIQVSLHW